MQTRDSLVDPKVNGATADQPRVTVLMAVHNGEKFLRQCVDSILRQTFSNFEFLIVDDGSTDGTSKVLNGYDDPRIVRVYQNTNRGLTASLNIGLGRSRGAYVARIDADDVAEIDRLERQVSYLDENPGVAVVGSWVILIDEMGEECGVWQAPTKGRTLEWQLSWRCALVHPSTLVRSEPLRAIGGYDENCRYAQDYDLWTRIVRNGGGISVLPARLTRYRVHNEQIGSTHPSDQFDCHIAISRRHIEWLVGESVTLDSVRQMTYLLNGGELLTEGDYQMGLALALRVQRACATRYDGERRHELDLLSDALIFSAKRCAAGGPMDALRKAFMAIHLSPFRCLRPAALVYLLAMLRLATIRRLPGVFKAAVLANRVTRQARRLATWRPCAESNKARMQRVRQSADRCLIDRVESDL